MSSFEKALLLLLLLRSVDYNEYDKSIVMLLWPYNQLLFLIGWWLWWCSFDHPINNYWIRFDPEGVIHCIYFHPVLFLPMFIKWGGLCCCFCYFIGLLTFLYLNNYIGIFFFNVGPSNSSPLNQILVPSYYDDDITQFWLTILLLFPIQRSISFWVQLFCCYLALIEEGWAIAPTFTGPTDSSTSNFIWYHPPLTLEGSVSICHCPLRFFNNNTSYTFKRRSRRLLMMIRTHHMTLFLLLIWLLVLLIMLLILILILRRCSPDEAFYQWLRIGRAVLWYLLLIYIFNYSVHPTIHVHVRSNLFLVSIFLLCRDLSHNHNGIILFLFVY